MKFFKGAPRYSAGHVIPIGLAIGAFLGVISQTVALLRTPDAIAAQATFTPQP